MSLPIPPRLMPYLGYIPTPEDFRKLRAMLNKKPTTPEKP
jgi:hypothetical protein